MDKKEKSLRSDNIVDLQEVSRLCEEGCEPYPIDSDTNKLIKGEPDYREAIIWVVDLDRGARELLKMKLSKSGFHQIFTFSNFNDFWRNFLNAMAEGNLPDIIIMSSNLGVVNPLEIARALKTTPKTRDINIIILTSRIAPSYRASAFEAGVDDVMLKPVNSEELIARLKLLLRNKYVRYLEKQLIVEKLQQEKERKLKEAYREIIAAVTSGKLLILEKAELREMLRDWRELASWKLEESKDVSLMREELRRILVNLNMPEDRIADFCLGVGEIATNSIKHADGGSAKLLYRESSVERTEEVGVLIEDKGKGIDFSKLARSTLLPGFSTKRWSLGMGFTLAISLTDGVILATDQNGTQVFLRKALREKTEEELIEEYLATFEEGNSIHEKS